MEGAMFWVAQWWAAMLWATMLGEVGAMALSATLWTVTVETR